MFLIFKLFFPPSYAIFLFFPQVKLFFLFSPVKLFSQQRYFELGPKKLELSYFSHSYAIFSPQSN